MKQKILFILLLAIVLASIGISNAMEKILGNSNGVCPEGALKYNENEVNIK
jgi:hypothetical protein